MLEILIERTLQPKPRPNEDQLGFGRYFSDHMFVADYFEGKWHSLRVVPYQNFEIDPAAAALHYGQAIFEGMKAFRGVDNKIRLFRPEMNWIRIKASADRLCMQAPSREVFLSGIEQLLRTDLSWIPTKPGTSLYIRPTLVATEAFLGVRPAQKYLFYVITSPVGAYYGDKVAPVKIWVERRYSRAAAGGIGATKAGGNYAASLAAAVEAAKKGYSQVLWLDAAQKKYIEEVGTMNVFFKINGKLITPNLTGTILPGVTRDCVLELMKHWNLPVEERPVELAEVLKAHANGTLEEVFGSGTAASITPVGALGVDEELLTVQSGDVGPLASKLFTYLTGVQTGQVKDELNWTRILTPPRQKSALFDFGLIQPATEP